MVWGQFTMTEPTQDLPVLSWQALQLHASQISIRLCLNPCIAYFQHYSIRFCTQELSSHLHRSLLSRNLTDIYTYCWKYSNFMATFSPHPAIIQVYLCNPQFQIPTDVLSLPDPKVKEAEITSLVPDSVLPSMSS